MITAEFLTTNDNLAKIVQEINQASWDEANDIAKFDVASLKAYLKCEDTLFVVCYKATHSKKTFLGMTSARLARKPYDNEIWLYIDEVDVCVNQRKQGAGKAMMEKLIAYANEVGCTEVWLGTELDNAAANALYKSLLPDATETFVGYTYKTKG